MCFAAGFSTDPLSPNRIAGLRGGKRNEKEREGEEGKKGRMYVAGRLNSIANSCIANNELNTILLVFDHGL